jgi:hypothetical protein
VPIGADRGGIAYEERTRAPDGAVTGTSRHRWALRDAVSAS